MKKVLSMPGNGPETVSHIHNGNTFKVDATEKDRVPQKNNQPYSGKVDGEEVCVIQGAQSPPFSETQVEDEKTNREKEEGHSNDKGAMNYDNIF